jgi:hypothetical protein
MPTDLPTAIRTALHADEIGAADLRRPVLREAPSRAPRSPRVLAVVATVAVVVALAVTISVVNSGRPGVNHPAAGPSASLAGIVGYRWDVTKVQDGHGAFSVPPGLDAYIGFTRNGYVRADDTVNFLSGRYRPQPGGYRVDDVATTLVAGGSDPQRRRLIDAVDAMLLAPAKDLTPFPPANVVTVAVRVDGDTLTLTSDKAHTTLTLIRAGGQPDATMARPSSTAPPTPEGTTARPSGAPTT